MVVKEGREKTLQSKKSESRGNGRALKEKNRLDMKWCEQGRKEESPWENLGGNWGEGWGTRSFQRRNQEGNGGCSGAEG